MCETKSFSLWLLQIVGLLGLLVLILWLSLRPQRPSVTVVELSIPPIDNSSSPLDDGNGNGDLLYEIEINNPNKDSHIYFDDILLMFFFGQDTAATDRIYAFNLGKDKSRNNRNHVNVDALSWKGFRNAISKNGTGTLKVDFSSRFRFKTLGIKSKHRGINLQADIQLGKDGKILGKEKRIRLKHESNKWRVRSSYFH